MSKLHNITLSARRLCAKDIFVKFLNLISFPADYTIFTRKRIINFACSSDHYCLHVSFCILDVVIGHHYHHTTHIIDTTTNTTAIIVIFFIMVLTVPISLPLLPLSCAWEILFFSISSDTWNTFYMFLLVEHFFLDMSSYVFLLISFSLPYSVILF